MTRRILVAVSMLAVSTFAIAQQASQAESVISKASSGDLLSDDALMRRMSDDERFRRPDFSTILRYLDNEALRKFYLSGVDPGAVQFEYDISPEWLSSLRKICPECMTPEHAPGLQGAKIQQLPIHAIGAEDPSGTCSIYAAVVASLREARKADALLMSAYKRRIVELEAKLKEQASKGSK